MSLYCMFFYLLSSLEYFIHVSSHPVLRWCHGGSFLVCNRSLDDLGLIAGSYGTNPSISMLGMELCLTNLFNEIVVYTLHSHGKKVHREKLSLSILKGYIDTRHNVINKRN